jgi:hypothetical protein
MAEEANRGQVLHNAVREVKWLANSLKGLSALAEELQEPLDIQKDVDALKAELVALRAERKNYTDLAAETAALRTEKASLVAEIEGIKARFKG